MRVSFWTMLFRRDPWESLAVSKDRPRKLETSYLIHKKDTPTEGASHLPGVKPVPYSLHKKKPSSRRKTKDQSSLVCTTPATSIDTRSRFPLTPPSQMHITSQCQDPTKNAIRSPHHTHMTVMRCTCGGYKHHHATP